MISLICSNYNSEKYIHNYLKYLDEQTLEEFEVVFVDAKSTDNSLNIIKDHKFKEGVSVNIVESGSKLTIYEAWNVGISISRNEYVMNYNTDDKLFPDSLEVMVSKIRENPDADLIYGNCIISNSLDHSSDDGAYNWMDASIDGNLLKGCCCGPFPLLKKSSVIKAGMFNVNLTISGDYEMWCRMKSLGMKLLKIAEPTGVYYHNPVGNSTTQSPERWNEHIRQDTWIRTTYEGKI